jgi:glutathione S-transferase
MLTIHHLGISQSDRIIWLCEELGIDYVLQKYDRDPATGAAPAAYKALTPFGTAPVIAHDALVLGESGAIIEYIIHRLGGGRLALTPSDAAYPDYLFWLHFANSSLMSALMVEMIIPAIEPAKPDIAEALRGRGNRAFGLVEQRLSDAPYFAGNEFTAADIIMAFPLTTMRLFVPREIAAYPKLKAYLAKIAERPAFKRALAVGDPGLRPVID